VSVAHLDRSPIDPATTEFLDALYGQAEAGWLTLFAVDPATGNRTVEWAPAAEPASLALAAGGLIERCDVWFGVATRKHQLVNDRGVPDGRRGGDSDCLELPGLWVDVDIAGPNHKTAGELLPPDEEAALELIGAFNLPATAIVHTGGGLHAYWLFNEMRAVSDLSDTLARWGATWSRLAGERGWAIDNVWDPARVLRLPGTWNRKNDPTPVRVIERWLRAV
jgi:hypothetical protein